MTMLCPRCDQQGVVVKVKIKATGEIVHLCDECDALWPEGINITIDNFVDFSTFVRPKGLKGFWSEIEKLESE